MSIRRIDRRVPLLACPAVNPAPTPRCYDTAGQASSGIRGGRPGPVVWAAVFCGLIGLLAGCGGAGGLDTAQVSGTVTFDGKPLAQGTVSFTPEKGRGATGQIASDGSYTLTTYKKGDGAVVGRHQVAIVAIDRQGATPTTLESMEKEITWLIPRRYGNPFTSGLTFEVKQGTKNVANFELSSQGGP